MLAQDYQDSVSMLFNQQSVLNLPSTAINSAPSADYHNCDTETSVNVKEDNFKDLNGSRFEDNLHDKFDHELIDIEVKSLSDSEEICGEGFEGNVYGDSSLGRSVGAGKNSFLECVEVCDTFYVEEPESEEEEGTEQTTGLEGNWWERKRETTAGYRLIERNTRISHKNLERETTESDCLQQEVRENEAKTSNVETQSEETLNANLDSTVTESEIQGIKNYTVSDSVAEYISNTQGALKNIQAMYIIESGTVEFGETALEYNCEQQNVSFASNLSSHCKMSGKKIATEALDGKIIYAGETEENIDGGNSDALISADSKPNGSYSRSTAFDWYHRTEPSQSSKALSTEEEQQLHVLETCDEKMNKIYTCGSLNQSSVHAAPNCDSVSHANQEKSVKLWSESEETWNKPISGSYQRCEDSVQQVQIYAADEENENRKSTPESNTSFPPSLEENQRENMSEEASEKEEGGRAAMLSSVAPESATQVHSKSSQHFDTFEKNRRERIQLNMPQDISRSDNLGNQGHEGQHHNGGRFGNNALIIDGYGTNDVRTSQNHQKAAIVCGCACNGSVVSDGVGTVGMRFAGSSNHEEKDGTIYLNSCSERYEGNSGSLSGDGSGTTITIAAGNTDGGLSCSAGNACQSRSMQNNNSDEQNNNSDDANYSATTISTEGTFCGAINVSTDSSYSVGKKEQGEGELMGSDVECEGAGGSLNQKHEFKFKSNNSSLLNSVSQKQKQNDNSKHSSQHPVTAQTQLGPHLPMSSSTSAEGITNRTIESNNRGRLGVDVGCDSTNCYNTSCGIMKQQEYEEDPSFSGSNSQAEGQFSHLQHQPPICSVLIGTNTSVSCGHYSPSHNLTNISQMQLNTCPQGGTSNTIPALVREVKGIERDNIQTESDTEEPCVARDDTGLHRYNRNCANTAEPAIDAKATGEVGSVPAMSSSHADLTKNGKDSRSQNEEKHLSDGKNLIGSTATTTRQSDYPNTVVSKMMTSNKDSDNVVSSLSTAAAVSSKAFGTAAAIEEAVDIKYDSSTDYAKQHEQKIQHNLLAMGANVVATAVSVATITNDHFVCNGDDNQTKTGNKLGLHERDLLVNGGRKWRKDYDRGGRLCPNQVPAAPVTELPPNKITMSHAPGLLSTNKDEDSSLKNHHQQYQKIPIPAASLCDSQAKVDSNNRSSKHAFSSSSTCGRNFEHHCSHSSEISHASRYDTLQVCESAIAPAQTGDCAIDGNCAVGNSGGSVRSSSSSNHGGANIYNINKEYLNSTDRSSNGKSHTVVVNSESPSSVGGCGNKSCKSGNIVSSSSALFSSSSTPISSVLCSTTSTAACIHPHHPNNICNPSYNSNLTVIRPPVCSSTYHNSVTNTSQHTTQNCNPHPHHASFSTFPVAVSSESSSEEIPTRSSSNVSGAGATDGRNFQNIHPVNVPASQVAGTTSSNCSFPQSQQNIPTVHFHNRPFISDNAQVCNCEHKAIHYQGMPGYDNKRNPTIATTAAQGLVRQDSNCNNSAHLLAHPLDYGNDRNVNICGGDVGSSTYNTEIVPIPGAIEHSKIFLNNQSQQSQRGCGGCCQSSKSIKGVPSSHCGDATLCSNRSMLCNQQSNYGNNSSAFMSSDGKLNGKDDQDTKSIQHFNSTTISQSAQPSGAANSLGCVQRDSSALHQLQEQRKFSCGENNIASPVIASNITNGRGAMAEQSSSYHQQNPCSPCNPNPNHSALKYNYYPPGQGLQQQSKQNDKEVMPETALTHSLNQTPVYYEAPTKSRPCSECCQYPPNQMAPFPNNKTSSNCNPPRNNSNVHSSGMSPPGRPVRATFSNSSETANSSSGRQRLAGSLSTASDPSVSGGSSCSSDSSPAKTLPTFGRGASKMSAGRTSCAVKEKKKKASHGATADAKGIASEDDADQEEEHKLLKADEKALNSVDKHIGELPKNCFQGKRLTAYGGRAPGPVNPDMLYEGIQYKCAYLGSTQLISTSRPNRTLRMQQAHEAVTRIKAPDGEFQPSVEVFLHISTDKLALVNLDNNESIIEHPLRTISYIADIANIIVIMARRIPAFNGNNNTGAATGNNPGGRGTGAAASAGSDSPDLGNGSHSNNADQNYPDSSQYLDDSDADGVYSLKPNKIVCHILECDKAQLIAQSIGQAFHLAYLDFLKENGIEDESSLELEYLDVLNSQELKGEDLMLFANKEASKDISIFKQKGELIGVVVIESGWGSVVPTFVIANLSPTGPAARSGLLNVGDQLLAIDGTSVVGLTLANVQAKLKSMKSEVAVRLTIVQCPPTTTVLIKRPSLRYQLGFSVQNGTICSLMRGGIAERGGIRVGHRIIEINRQSVVAVPHDKIVEMLATSVGQLHMKTMPLPMFRLLTGQDTPSYL